MSDFSEEEIHAELRIMLDALLPGWGMSEATFKTGLQESNPAKNLVDATWDKVWSELLASGDVIEVGGKIRRRH